MGRTGMQDACARASACLRFHGGQKRTLVSVPSLSTMFPETLSPLAQLCGYNTTHFVCPKEDASRGWLLFALIFKLF